MFKNIIASSDNPIYLPIKAIYYAFKNKYYEVEKLIEKSEILDNDNILLHLKNGLKFISKPTKFPVEINFLERYKFGIKSKMKNIHDINKYFFIYDLIHEVFLNNNYFQFFDIPKNGTVIDAGANLGSFVLLAAQKLNNTGKIYAIEPDNDNFEILSENIKINGFKNIEIIKKGLWSNCETKEFFISHRPGEHTIVSNHDENFKQIDKTTIECITLDRLAVDLNIKQIDFIKMDIEGAEIEAIEGSKNVLQMKGINWVVEALHLVDGEPTYKKLLPVFKSNGYNIHAPVDNYRGTIFASK
jgi:FkbM family methyltransferase